MSERDHKLPVLEGDRIRLRWLDESDVPSLFRVFSNAEVTRYWSSPPLTSPDGARDLLSEIHELFASGELYQWGLARRDDDVVVGTCTLAWIDRRHKRCEVGFALHPDHQGQGLAREAVVILLRWAFEELDMHRIEADIDPRNEASIRLVERLGFRKEGHLRERYHLYGEVQDSLIFGLLRREFDPS